MPKDCSIQHHLYTDQPLLTLHITSFANATLVAITLPHSLTDATGASDLLRAWASIVSGNPSLVKPLQGTYEDVLQDIGTPDDLKDSKDDEFVLEKQQLRGVALVVFIVRYLWDIMFRRTIETEHIYLPAEFLRALRKDAEAELSTCGSSNIPFVSDNDLILAWGTRMILSSSSAWDRCSAVICNAFEMRGRLDRLGFYSSTTVTQAASPYVQNLVLVATTVLPSDKAATAAIAHIAQLIRKAIIEQTTDVQCRQLMRLTRAWLASLGTLPLFAKWDSRVIACSSWTRARFLNAADFSWVGGGREGAAGSIKPVMYWETTQGDKTRDCFVVYGKDAVGNYWVYGYLRPDAWKHIEKELDGWPGIETAKAWAA